MSTLFTFNNKLITINSKLIEKYEAPTPPPGPSDIPIIYFEDVDVVLTWATYESGYTYSTDFTDSDYLVIKFDFAGGGGNGTDGTFTFEFDSDHFALLRIPKYGQSGPSPVWYGDGTVNVLSSNVTQSGSRYTSSYAPRTPYGGSGISEGTPYKMIYEKSTGLCTILLSNNGVWEAQVSSVLSSGLNSFHGFVTQTDNGFTAGNLLSLSIASCNTYETAFAY